MDVLSRIVSKRIKGNVIVSFEVEVHRVPLSHLQFADDTLFFCFSKEDSFLMLNHVLAFFEEMIGLKINGRKAVLWQSTIMRKNLQDGLSGLGVTLAALPPFILVYLLEVILSLSLCGTPWGIKFKTS